jgi:hypothetical protein
MVERLDPYRLDPDDTTAWMLLLTLDLEKHESLSHLTPRIAVALSHCPMGPTASVGVDQGVLGRMIDRWLGDARSLCGNRDRLLIAMRYGRQQSARVLCRLVLDDDSAPAATVTSALLAASVLRCEGLEMQASKRLEDSRVAQVWQLVPQGKSKIRTEVRDVALALLLHHQGIDPRNAGFEELRADPLLIFCEHSLGFPDEATRLDTRRRANLLLAK